MSMRPLEGYTVGITADRRSEEQAELLRRRGANVQHGPTIATAYLAQDDALRQATARIVDRPPDYLVATTGIGMRAWLEATQAWGVGERLLDALASTKVAARGPKAAAAVQAGGLAVWERSPNERMDELIALLLSQDLRGRTVAVQEYGEASPELSLALIDAGAEVVGVPVYRWRMPDDHAPALRLIDAACAERVQAVTFTSAPAVHNMFRLAEAAGRHEELRAAFNGDVVAACVGAVCAGGARKEGIEAPLEPAVGRLGLLVRALSERLEQRQRTVRLAGVDVAVQGSSLAIGADVVTLPPLERTVFDLLAARPGAVVSRATLLGRGWRAADADPRPLEATIGRLRRRLGPCGAALQGVAGRGYKLEGD